MYEMMDPQVSRQRREEMLRQAERGRVAGALPAIRMPPWTSRRKHS
jgi:hypothetical protein